MGFIANDNSQPQTYIHAANEKRRQPCKVSGVRFQSARSVSVMPCIEIAQAPQAVSSPTNHYPSPAAAIALASERFSNLCREGILPRKFRGTPIDLDEVAIAMAFLGRCRTTQKPTCHTFDLMKLVGVAPGALIAAAVGLGFSPRSWYGTKAFHPHAMINANLNDVRQTF